MSIPICLIACLYCERPALRWLQAYDNALLIVDDRGIESLKVIALD